jgi:thiamine-monophosphate kinase
MRESQANPAPAADCDQPRRTRLADDTALLDGLSSPKTASRKAVTSCRPTRPASVGWKLVAVNLSDLAAKARSPQRRFFRWHYPTMTHGT